VSVSVEELCLLFCQRLIEASFRLEQRSPPQPHGTATTDLTLPQPPLSLPPVAQSSLARLGAAFGAFPVTSFSQNAGVVNFTGVMSRHVVGVAGVILALLGLSPKVGAAVATIPSPVFGGVVLLMSGMVAASGARLVFLHTDLDRRNVVILGVSLGLGLGVATRPEALRASRVRLRRSPANRWS
jgi:hypothetical protein